MRRGERGTTLVELLVALSVLSVAMGVSYALIVLIGRGSTLLQEQLEAQQHAGVAMEWLINDLRNARDYTVSAGPPLRLSITKTTALSCPANTGATQLIVDYAGDLRVNDAILVVAAPLGLTETKTITGIAAVTCPGGQGRDALTIAPALTNSFPGGSLVSTTVPTVTYELTSARQLLRNGAILADEVSTLCLSDQRAALTAATTSGATVATINGTNASCPAANTPTFAVGDIVFVEDEIRTVTAVSGSSLTLDLGLVNAHAAGAPVRRKALAIQLTVTRQATQAGGNLVQTVTLTSRGVVRN